MKVVHWIACLAIAAGCSEYKPCRPGTVRISVVCDTNAKDVAVASLRVDDRVLPEGKDILVPLQCPGKTSVELAVADYASGRTLTLAATPRRPPVPVERANRWW